MQRLKAWLITFLLKALGTLPLRYARALGVAVGRAAWRLDTRMVKTTQTNIDLCYPNLMERERKQFAHASILATATLLVETLSIWRNGARGLKNAFAITQGEALLKAELAKNAGLIVLAPHLGNWEVLGYSLLKHGDLACLYRPTKNACVDSYVIEQRQNLGITVLPTTGRGIAKLLRHIKNGGMTGILPDQVPDSGSGQFADFFGQPAYTMTLIHGLIQRTGCRVLLSFAKRVDQGFEIYHLSPNPDIYSSDLTTSEFTAA